METIGQIFRAAREKKQVTPSQAAAATRMKVQHVEALERNDFSKMAAPTYARGFIKLYAEYLGLDPAPLLQQYADYYAPGKRPPADMETVLRGMVKAPPRAQPPASAAVSAEPTAADATGTTGAPPATAATSTGLGATAVTMPPAGPAEPETPAPESIPPEVAAHDLTPHTPHTPPSAVEAFTPTPVGSTMTAPVQAPRSGTWIRRMILVAGAVVAFLAVLLTLDRHDKPVAVNQVAVRSAPPRPKDSVYSIIQEPADPYYGVTNVVGAAHP